MYFDFDDRYRDIETVGSAINRRDGVAAAIIVHLLLIILMLVAPDYIERYLPARVVPPPEQQRPKDNPMFVFVQPKADLPPLRKPDRVEMSDVDRSARSSEKSPKLENPLPAA